MNLNGAEGKCITIGSGVGCDDADDSSIGSSSGAGGSSAGGAGDSGTGMAVTGSPGAITDGIGDTQSVAGGSGSAAEGGVGDIVGWVSAMADSGVEDVDSGNRDHGAGGEADECCSSEDVERGERGIDSFVSPSPSCSSQASQPRFTAFLVLFYNFEEIAGEECADP